MNPTAKWNQLNPRGHPCLHLLVTNLALNQHQSNLTSLPTEEKETSIIHLSSSISYFPRL